MGDDREDRYGLGDAQDDEKMDLENLRVDQTAGKDDDKGPQPEQPDVDSRWPADATTELLTAGAKALGKGTLKGAETAFAHLLPNVYMTASELKAGWDDLVDAKEEAMKQMIPELRKLQRSTKRLLPRVTRYMPPKLRRQLQDATEGWEQKGVGEEKKAGKEMSEAEQRDAKMTAAIHEALGRQAQLTQTLAQEDRANKKMDDILESVRFQQQQKTLMSMDRSLMSMDSFNRKVHVEFLKKGLEMQYKHLFVAQDVKSIMERLAPAVEAKLEEIKHNTGLPEYTKVRGIEEQLRQQRLRVSRGIGQYFARMRERMVKGGFNRATQGLKDIGQVAGMAADASETDDEMEGMLDDEDESQLTERQKKRREKVRQGSGLVGRLAGSTGGKRVLRNFSEQFKDLDVNAENFTEKMAMRFAQTGRKMESKGGLLGLVGKAFPALTEQDSEQISGPGIEEGTKGTPFDVATRRSIVEIIPGFQAKQLKVLQDLAYGGEHEERVFSPTREEFTTEGQFREDVFGQALGKPEERGMKPAKAAGVAREAASRREGGGETAEQFDQMRDEVTRVLTNHAVYGWPLMPSDMNSWVNGTEGYSSKYITTITEGVDNPSMALNLLVAGLYTDQGLVNSQVQSEMENYILGQMTDQQYKSIMANLFQGYGQRRRFKDILTPQGEISRQGIAAKLSESKPEAREEAFRGAAETYGKRETRREEEGEAMYRAVSERFGRAGPYLARAGSAVGRGMHTAPHYAATAMERMVGSGPGARESAGEKQPSRWKTWAQEYLGQTIPEDYRPNFLTPEQKERTDESEIPEKRPDGSGKTAKGRRQEEELKRMHAVRQRGQVQEPEEPIATGEPLLQRMVRGEGPEVGGAAGGEADRSNLVEIYNRFWKPFWSDTVESFSQYYRSIRDTLQEIRDLLSSGPSGPEGPGGPEGPRGPEGRPSAPVYSFPGPGGPAPSGGPVPSGGGPQPAGSLQLLQSTGTEAAMPTPAPAQTESPAAKIQTAAAPELQRQESEPATIRQPETTETAAAEPVPEKEPATEERTGRTLSNRMQTGLTTAYEGVQRGVGIGREYAESAAETVRERAPSMRERASQYAGRAAEGIRKRGQQAAETGREYKQQAQESINNEIDRLKQTIESRLQTAEGPARERLEQARQKLNNLTGDLPLRDKVSALKSVKDSIADYIGDAEQRARTAGAVRERAGSMTARAGQAAGRAREAVRDRAPTREQVGSVTDRIQETAEPIRQQVEESIPSRERIEGVRDQAAGAVSNISRRGRETEETVSAYVPDMESVKETFSSLAVKLKSVIPDREQVTETAGQMRESIGERIPSREQAEAVQERARSGMAAVTGAGASIPVDREQATETAGRVREETGAKIKQAGEAAWERAPSQEQLAQAGEKIKSSLSDAFTSLVESFPDKDEMAGVVEKQRERAGDVGERIQEKTEPVRQRVAEYGPSREEAREYGKEMKDRTTDTADRASRRIMSGMRKVQSEETGEEMPTPRDSRWQRMAQRTREGAGRLKQAGGERLVRGKEHIRSAYEQRGGGKDASILDKTDAAVRTGTRGAWEGYKGLLGGAWKGYKTVGKGYGKAFDFLSGGYASKALDKLKSTGEETATEEQPLQQTGTRVREAAQVGGNRIKNAADRVSEPLIRKSREGSVSGEQQEGPDEQETVTQADSKEKVRKYSNEMRDKVRSEAEQLQSRIEERLQNVEGPAAERLQMARDRMDEVTRMGENASVGATVKALNTVKDSVSDLTGRASEQIAPRQTGARMYETARVGGQRVAERAGTARDQIRSAVTQEHGRETQPAESGVSVDEALQQLGSEISDQIKQTGTEEVETPETGEQIVSRLDEVKTELSQGGGEAGLGAEAPSQFWQDYIEEKRQTDARIVDLLAIIANENTDQPGMVRKALSGAKRGLSSTASFLGKTAQKTIGATGMAIGGTGKGLGSILGGLYSGTGSVLGGALGAGGQILGTGKDILGGAAGKIFGRSKARSGKRKRKFFDVYRQGEIEPGNPLLSARKQQDGEAIFDDGKRIKRTSDIDRPVLDAETGDTLISQTDLDHGLVDVYGNPIYEKSMGAGSGVMGKLGSTLKKLAGGGVGLGGGMAGMGLDLVKGIGSAGAGAVKGIWNKLMGNKTPEDDPMLLAIRDIRDFMKRKFERVDQAIERMIKLGEGSMREGSYYDLRQEGEQTPGLLGQARGGQLTKASSAAGAGGLGEKISSAMEDEGGDSSSFIMKMLGFESSKFSIKKLASAGKRLASKGGALAVSGLTGGLGLSGLMTSSMSGIVSAGAGAIAGSVLAVAATAVGGFFAGKGIRALPVPGTDKTVGDYLDKGVSYLAEKVFGIEQATPGKDTSETEEQRSSFQRRMKAQGIGEEKFAGPGLSVDKGKLIEKIRQGGFTPETLQLLATQKQVVQEELNLTAAEATDVQEAAKKQREQRRQEGKPVDVPASKSTLAVSDEVASTEKLISDIKKFDVGLGEITGKQDIVGRNRAFESLKKEVPKLPGRTLEWLSEKPDRLKDDYHLKDERVKKLASLAKDEMKKREEKGVAEKYSSKRRISDFEAVKQDLSNLDVDIGGKLLGQRGTDYAKTFKQRLPGVSTRALREIQSNWDHYKENWDLSDKAAESIKNALDSELANRQKQEQAGVSPSAQLSGALGQMSGLPTAVQPGERSRPERSARPGTEEPESEARRKADEAEQRQRALEQEEQARRQKDQETISQLQAQNEIQKQLLSTMNVVAENTQNLTEVSENTREMKEQGVGNTTVAAAPVQNNVVGDGQGSRTGPHIDINKPYSMRR